MGVRPLALFLTVLFGGAAAAQSATEKPPGATSANLEAVSAWYQANVKAGAEWRVRFYLSNGLVMSGADTRLDRAGHAAGRIRVELTSDSAVNGISWRSALITTDENCIGKVTQDRGRGVIASTRDPGSIVTTLYEGQNLSGPGHTVGRINILLDQVQRAMAETCKSALANAYDKRGVETAPVLARAPAALTDWAHATLDLSGWIKPAYSTNDVRWVSDEIDSRGGKKAIKIRTEYLDPILTPSTVNPVINVVIDGKNTGVNLTDAMVWGRSETQEYSLNCATRTFEPGRTTIYGANNLKSSIGISGGYRSGTDTPFSTEHRNLDVFEAVCAGP